MTARRLCYSAITRCEIIAIDLYSLQSRTRGGKFKASPADVAVHAHKRESDITERNDIAHEFARCTREIRNEPVR